MVGSEVNLLKLLVFFLFFFFSLSFSALTKLTSLLLGMSTEMLNKSAYQLSNGVKIN